MKKMLSACLCCRKKVPKNEFLGLEGMVKIKNPEDNVENGEKSQPITHNQSSTLLPGNDNDSKRASNAPHRSLPDIPVAESMINNDNGSELYATVADKVHEKPQGRSPTTSLKKQASVSQHSSISQADDVSSPYARVKTPPHDYDKVRPTEHPYAQLNTPGQGSSTYQPIEEDAVDSVCSRRDSDQSELGEAPVSERHNEIPAASAIAGMVSASQELPYMTPPIVQQPHFSGDSQDSSKGYTSITVREPLANLLAQTKRTHPRLISKNGNDSHYATVSDDSDEMYAAIDDPNNHGDIYTSGSETYAQIQPAAANHVVVSVDINTTALRLHNQIATDVPPSRSINTTTTTATNIRHINETPVPPPVDSLRAQMHSRQASSSSNTSSVGILGSPKPEKRQANSPLPPTPKMIQFNSTSNLTSTSSSIPSGRNSVASVIDNQLQSTGKAISRENLNIDTEEDSPGRKSFNSPSKDIEGMYAKVMKKTKLSTAPSQNSSPVLRRKLSVDTMNNSGEIGSSDSAKVQASPGKSSIKSASYIENNYETIDKRRIRSNSYNSKDHGYETIRSDVTLTTGIPENKDRLESYAQINRMKTQKKVSTENPIQLLKIDLNQTVTNFPSENLCSSSQNYEPGYESLPDKSLSTNDPGYETLLKTTNANASGNNENLYNENKNPNSDYDPNYEVLRHQSGKYSGNSDDGYAKVFEKNSMNNDTDNDTTDGYSKVKERLTDETDVPGYSTISEESVSNLKKNHDYASISEAKEKLNYSNKKSSNNNYSNLNQNNNNGNSNNNNNNSNNNNNNHNNNSIKNSTKTEKPNLDSSSETDLYTNISNVRTHHLSLSSITPDDFTNSSSINYPNFSDTAGGENATTVSSTTNTTPLSSTKSSEKLMNTPSPVTGQSMSDKNDISTTMMTTSSALLMMTPSTAATGTTTSTMMKYNSTSNTTISSCSLQQLSTNSSSNYESLTGSESDPNYESVRFLDTENPYEPLQNDPNISPDVSGKNSFTNDDSYYSNTTGRNSIFSRGTPSPSANIDSNNKSPVNNLTNKSLQNNENPGQVDDYFQV